MERELNQDAQKLKNSASWLKAYYRHRAHEELCAMSIRRTSGAVPAHRYLANRTRPAFAVLIPLYPKAAGCRRVG